MAALVTGEMAHILDQADNGDFGLAKHFDAATDVGRLERRMILGALAEAALTIAESDDPERLAPVSERRVAQLLRAFRS